ncbi:MAG: AmmeMemoRadiSam system radical SAM enzyme [Candidatus Gastranaerophilales bacterium]|nr:AmmeMemoRadiSam system radical SAM enzyme [Candidatus Gastranaerophilales bacterium]
MNTKDRIVKTKYWKKLPDGRVMCYLCPRHCKLKEGQKGFCFIRERQNDEVVMTSYGYSTGFAIDPIEKKPLNHFYPGTTVFSFGTAGCNLGCKFCQNWEISKAKQIERLSQKGLPKDIAIAAKEYECKSVAFTYNDPVIFIEYVIDTAIECHKLGLKTVAVTAGYISDEARADFFEYIDAANVDLKGFSDSFYKNFCAGDLQTVLNTLLYLKNETNVWFEITTLLIPGENDSVEDLENECKWIVDNLGADVPLHFTAFHPDWKMMDKESTKLEILLKAHAIAKKAGIKYVYTGNVAHPETSTTYCHSCHKPLIKRTWHEVSEYNLIGDGECKFCKTKCAGRF